MVHLALQGLKEPMVKLVRKVTPDRLVPLESQELQVNMVPKVPMVRLGLKVNTEGQVQREQQERMEQLAKQELKGKLGLLVQQGQLERMVHKAHKDQSD